MNRQITAMATCLAALGLHLGAHAGVSTEEAARLKTDLTPNGAEKAGNKDGSIPAWNGGYTMPIPGDKPGGRRGDPFKDEKPLYSIHAKNAEQHADKLTDGTKALLAKYPDSFRIDVYKTHRSAAAPQWAYDNTFKNATRAKLNGDQVEGAYGGIPFPIPKVGAEVMWNHILRWRGTSWQFQTNMYQLTADGKAVQTTEGIGDSLSPYYLPEGQPDKWNGDFWRVRVVNSGPPIRAGEAIVGRENLDPSKSQSWVYLTGQRRVRKLPNPCCDTPAQVAAGVMSMDEIEVFMGRLDQFDWKLIGKREMIIPYNTNRLLQPTTDAEVLAAHHLAPNHMRWELHRVWVVEATLREGKRHQARKSRYYCDEDTWTCVLGDRWDHNGQLWKTLWANTFVAPDFPGVLIGSFGFNDLLAGTAFVSNLFNQKKAHYPIVPRLADSHFTPDGLAAGGAR